MSRARRLTAVLALTGALLALCACASSVDPLERLGRKAAEKVTPRPHLHPRLHRHLPAHTRPHGPAGWLDRPEWTTRLPYGRSGLLSPVPSAAPGSAPPAGPAAPSASPALPSASPAAPLVRNRGPRPDVHPSRTAEPPQDDATES